MKVYARNFMPALARFLDSTALHIAVRKGDAELVQILMRHGSSLIIKDASGFTPLDASFAYPEINSAMKMMSRRLSFARVESEEEKNHNDLQSQLVLGRRISTATAILHPMWLISLDTMLKKYDKKGSVADAHQDLKKRNLLTNWDDLPLDARVIFVSHEWVGWKHPDPRGVRIRFCLFVCLKSLTVFIYTNQTLSRSNTGTTRSTRKSNQIPT